MDFNIVFPAFDPNLIYGMIGLFGTIGVMGYALYKTVKTGNFPGRWTAVFVVAQLFIFVIFGISIAPAINDRAAAIQDAVQAEVSATYGIDLSEETIATLVGPEVYRRLGGDKPEETTWTSPHLATITHDGRETTILLAWQDGQWLLMEQVDAETVRPVPLQR